jgi:hypothetical protein
MLVDLPDGIAHEHVNALIPERGWKAMQNLRKLTLAQDVGDRLVVLAPVRDVVKARTRRSISITHKGSSTTYLAELGDDIYERLAKHYLEMVHALGPQRRLEEAVELAADLSGEASNIEEIIKLINERALDIGNMLGSTVAAEALEGAGRLGLSSALKKPGLSRAALAWR